VGKVARLAAIHGPDYSTRHAPVFQFAEAVSRAGRPPLCDVVRELPS